MVHHGHRLLALLAAFLLFTPGSGFPEMNASAEAQGAALLAPFKQQLMGALQAGLVQGPVAAIDACRLEAPAIAEGLGTTTVQLGRTSHRLRNPDNAGPGWAEDVLDAYLQQSGDWQARVVQLPGGRQGYIEPIVTQPLCLACHGEQLDESVLAILREHYPEDRATGFAPGALRGVFWVRFVPQGAAQGDAAGDAAR